MVKFHYYPFAGTLPTCSAPPYMGVNQAPGNPLEVKSISLEVSKSASAVPVLTWKVVNEENILDYNVEKKHGWQRIPYSSHA